MHGKHFLMRKFDKCRESYNGGSWDSLVPTNVL